MSFQTKWRVWWIPQVPMKPFEHEVSSLESARDLAKALALYDLFQFENRIKPDYCNAGGIQYSHPLIDNGDWLELDDDEDGVADQLEEIAAAERAA